MGADSVSLLLAVALAYVPIAIRARSVIRRERRARSGDIVGTSVGGGARALVPE